MLGQVPKGPSGPQVPDLGPDRSLIRKQQVRATLIKTHRPVLRMECFKRVIAAESALAFLHCLANDMHYINMMLKVFAVYT